MYLLWLTKIAGHVGSKSVITTSFIWPQEPLQRRLVSLDLAAPFWKIVWAISMMTDNIEWINGANKVSQGEGLERWSNRSLEDRREASTKHAIQKLLSLQEVMRLTGHRCVDKDELGRQYVELTQTAKNFALLLGHADHHAVVSSTDMEGRSPSMSRQQLLLRAFRQCPVPRILLIVWGEVEANQY